MGSYQVALKSSAEKDLRALPPEVIERIYNRIEDLKTSPISRQSIKMSGAEQTYRIRVGNYRIIFQVDHKNTLVTIYHIRHRKNVYR